MRASQCDVCRLAWSSARGRRRGRSPSAATPDVGPFASTFADDHRRGRVPVAARPGVHRSIKTPEQMTPAQGADLAGRPGDLRIRRARSTTSTRCPIDGTTRELALFEPGRQQSTVHRPGEPGRAPPIVWQGSWRTLEPSLGVRAAARELRRDLGPHRVPEAALQHASSSQSSGSIGTLLSCTLVAYGFARFRFPGRGRAVHAAHRHDLPALGGDAHPDLHDLPEAGLDRHVAAAPRARPSWPTPTTCSSSASTC